MEEGIGWNFENVCGDVLGEGGEAEFGEKRPSAEHICCCVYIHGLC